jgi:hypothetical protein
LSGQLRKKQYKSTITHKAFSAHTGAFREKGWLSCDVDVMDWIMKFIAWLYGINYCQNAHPNGQGSYQIGNPWQLPWVTEKVNWLS